MVEQFELNTFKMSLNLSMNCCWFIFWPAFSLFLLLSVVENLYSHSILCLCLLKFWLTLWKFLDHNYMEYEHLLLGFLREGKGVAAPVIGTYFHLNLCLCVCAPLEENRSFAWLVRVLTMLVLLLEEYGTNLIKLAEEVTYDPSFLNDRLLMMSHYVLKLAYFLFCLYPKNSKS